MLREGGERGSALGCSSQLPDGGGAGKVDLPPAPQSNPRDARPPPAPPTPPASPR